MEERTEYTDRDGVKYTAQPVPRDADGNQEWSCGGCAFNHDLDGCTAAPACNAFQREDAEYVVWVKKQKEGKQTWKRINRRLRPK